MYTNLNIKRLSILTLCFIIMIFWSSCREDFSFSPSTGNLEFSKDTVYLDTVFTNIGSSTYNLKVYNRSDEDIVIPTIQFEQGVNSFYRMNVDGSTGVIGSPEEGKIFNEVELLAKDSLFIFIETTADIQTLSNNALQFLYTDKILFDSGPRQQAVDLVTLIKDAIFIYPDRDNTTGVFETLSFDVDGDGNLDNTTLQGRFLMDSELNFTNQKPYVVYGYAAVDEGKTLTIDAGARVHFHRDSGILVTNDASIKVNGALSTDQDLLENEVIFEGDRLEPGFAETPGQWGTIWLFSGSKENEFNYATIKNSTLGILAENNPNPPIDKLTIRNSQIYNSSSFGILGRATSITAENLVINNSGQSSFAGTLGGKYNFTHCTIANYWNSSFRDLPALLLNDFNQLEDGTVQLNDLTEANFNNCIIYGNDNPEFLLESAGSASVFNFKFTNCLLRFNNSSLANTGLYQLSDPTFFENNVFNVDPEFKAPFENDLRICPNSGADGAANTLFLGQDILGVNRDASSPDVGAYESLMSCDD